MTLIWTSYDNSLGEAAAPKPCWGLLEGHQHCKLVSEASATILPDLSLIDSSLFLSPSLLPIHSLQNPPRA